METHGLETAVTFTSTMTTKQRKQSALSTSCH